MSGMSVVKKNDAFLLKGPQDSDNLRLGGLAL